MGMIERLGKKLQIAVQPELVTIHTVEEAIKYRHIGGPTIQINSLDIEPAARTIEQFNLS